MTFRKIIATLEAEVIFNSIDIETEIYSVCSTDLMSDLLRFSIPESLLITGLTQPQVVRTAEIADVTAIAFIQDKRPEKEAIELARQKGISLVVTRLSMFTACGKLYVEGLRSFPEDNK